MNYSSVNINSINRITNQSKARPIREIYLTGLQSWKGTLGCRTFSRYFLRLSNQPNIKGPLQSRPIRNAYFFFR